MKKEKKEKKRKADLVSEETITPKKKKKESEKEDEENDEDYKEKLPDLEDLEDTVIEDQGNVPSYSDKNKFEDLEDGYTAHLTDLFLHINYFRCEWDY